MQIQESCCYSSITEWASKVHTATLIKGWIHTGKLPGGINHSLVKLCNIERLWVLND